MKTMELSRDRKKALKEQYLQMKTYCGIIQIKNKENGKLFLDSFPNLKNRWLTISAQLEQGRHFNSALQTDWNTYGKDAFVYTILEEENTEDFSDVRFELEKMMKSWMEKLQPYGEKGYHKPKIKK